MTIPSSSLLCLAPVAALAIVLPPAALAADTGADATLTLGTVDIRTTAAGPLATRNVFSSVDVVGGEVLQDQHVDYSWELLSRAPGIQVTPFRQGTDAGRFSMRGFNGEGRINAVKLLIDGIPSNDNAGGMPFLDAVSPLEIEVIEIVRGTNDPRYGLNNIAGNANVWTRTGGNEGRASVTLGSFGTREVQIAKGIESGNWSQNYAVSWREGSGWRDHSDANRRSVSGKWFYTADSGRWRAGLTARAFRNDALESGYLTAAQAAVHTRSSPAYAAWDRSTRETGQLGLHLDAELADRLSLQTRAYVNHYENQRFVRFSEAGVQQERDNDETQRGASSVLTWRPQVAWAHEFTLEGGVDAQWQRNAGDRWRTVQRVRTAQIRDWNFDLDTQGAYLQAVVRPVAALKLVPALRVDRIRGHLTDGLAGRTYPTYDYGTIQQPKFSAAYAFTDTVSAYGNWGRTFQIGTGIDSYRTQSRNVAPSINDGWEIGVKLRPVEHVDARIALWRQKASGEVSRVLGVDGLVDPGGLGNVGRTLRKGWDVQLNAHLRPGVTAWAAYSRQEARIVVPDASAPATAGREIENVPHYLASAGLRWQVDERLRVGASASAQGAYYLERTNMLGRTGSYALLNLEAGWRFTPALEVSAQVRNATDRRYVYAWYDSGSSGYSPGDGRSYAVSLNWKF